MSSRWISTSLRRPATSFSRLIAACAALTSDDLPMPRAPHRSALLAGRPRAKRWRVLDQKVAHPVDPAQERKIDAVDARDRRQRAAIGAPDESLRRLEIRLLAGGGHVRAQAPRRCGGGGRLGFRAAARAIQFSCKGEALPRGRPSSKAGAVAAGWRSRILRTSTPEGEGPWRARHRP